MSAENMWGEINAPVNQRTPTSILREQASILSQLTKGVLIGSIEQEPTDQQHPHLQFFHHGPRHQQP